MIPQILICIRQFIVKLSDGKIVTICSYALRSYSIECPQIGEVLLIRQTTHSALKKISERILPNSPSGESFSHDIQDVVDEPREFPHKTLERLTGYSEAEFGPRLEKLEELDLGKFQPDLKVGADNAYVMAALSALVYESPQDQIAFLESQPAVKNFTFLDSASNAEAGVDAPDTGTQLSLYQMDDALIVSARGTVFATEGPGFFDREWEDLINNVNTYPVDNYDHSAKVHEGFKKAADGIWGQLKPHLIEAASQGKKIHFTGHSLGASVATHLATRTHLELSTKVKSLVTFGGPATGWFGQEKHLEQCGVADASIRFAASGDPTVWAVPGGQHAGDEAYFNRGGELELGEGWNIQDRFLSMTWDNVVQGRHPVSHHHTLNYCNLIDQNRELLDNWPPGILLD